MQDDGFDNDVDEIAEGRKVRYLNELREPGRGWRHQAEFLRVIERVGDENDRMVKLLRNLRLGVSASLLSESAWELILIAAEGVLDWEQNFPDGRLPGEDE